MGRGESAISRTPSPAYILPSNTNSQYGHISHFNLHHSEKPNPVIFETRH